MTKKSVFKISGMHCSACALNIDMELEETEGVKQANTSYAKQITEVSYDDKVLSDSKIVEVIKKVGYEVVGSDS